MKVRFTQIPVIAILSTNSLQGSVATLLRIGWIFFQKFTAKAVGEKFLKIG